MRSGRIVVSTAAAFLFAAVPAWLPLAAQQGQGQGQAVVTVLPHNKEAAPMNVTDQDLAVHVNGKLAKVTGWTPASDGPLELVVLIDGSARVSLARQFGDIGQFVRVLPPNVKAAIAYMDQGRADFVAPFSADHAQVLKNLHLPGGMAGTDASPYFCLSYLAKNWPSNDASARREVIMITDGVDRYNLRYDPNDPYLQAAIKDAARAHLVVFSIYWADQGRIDTTDYENNAGQNLLQQLSEGTGGKAYWIGSGNPVTFQPYFDELLRRFQNQYELGVTAPLRGKAELDTMKLKLSAPGAEVDAPNEIYITPGQP